MSSRQSGPTFAEYTKPRSAEGGKCRKCDEVGHQELQAETAAEGNVLNGE